MERSMDGDERHRSTRERRPTAFGHPYRRELLRCRRERPVHLADLAREIVRRRDGRADGGDDPEAVYLELYHDHAPRLADAGAVSFDPETRMVSFPGGREG